MHVRFAWEDKVCSGYDGGEDGFLEVFPQGRGSVSTSGSGKKVGETEY